MAGPTSPSSNEFESDRDVTLREARLLREDLARLRAETDGLRRSVVTRDEHVRRRRNVRMALATSLALVLVAVGLYVHHQAEVERRHQEFQQGAYEACLQRNEVASDDAREGIAEERLFTDLMAAERVPSSDVEVSESRRMRLRAYQRYRDSIGDLLSKAQNQQPVDCSRLKPKGD